MVSSAMMALMPRWHKKFGMTPVVYEPSAAISPMQVQLNLRGQK